MAFTDEGAAVIAPDHDRFLFMLFAISMWFHTREQRGVPGFREAIDLFYGSDYWLSAEIAEVVEFLEFTGACAPPTVEDLEWLRDAAPRFELELA